MKILLLGKNGQVGHELQRTLAPLGGLTALGHAECDLADGDRLGAVVAEARPDLIVNAAAYTAVDRAESEPDLAQAINGTAPGILGVAARRQGAVVIHYSTDYVFDGSKLTPYSEDDLPVPLGMYGASKLKGEQALAGSGCDYLIFRTSWVFGAHGVNFAKTMLRLAAEKTSLRVVADQHGAPTGAALIADVTAHVVARLQRNGRQDFPFGLYHLAAAGATTWHDYACAVVAAAHAAGLRLTLQPEAIAAITTAEYPLPAPRPANSRLDTTRLQTTFDYTLPDWKIGLQQVLAQLLTTS